MPTHRRYVNRDLARAMRAVPDTDLPDDDDDVRRDERRGRILFGVLVAIVALAVLGVALFTLRGQGAEDRAEVAEVQRDETAAQALSLAEQIRAECDAGRLAGAICEQADDVAQEPIPPVQPRDGVDGRPGLDGRDGIDGQSPICLATPAMCQGADGADGAAGAPGADGQDGTDGADGADGTDGQDGEPPAGFTFVDGTGTEQTCTRDPASPDDAAFYRCTAPAEGDAEPAVMGLTLFR